MANKIFAVRVIGMVFISTTSMTRIFSKAKISLRTAMWSPSRGKNVIPVASSSGGLLKSRIFQRTRILKPTFSRVTV